MALRCTPIFFGVVGLAFACGGGKSSDEGTTTSTATTNMVVDDDGDDDDDGETSDPPMTTSGIDPDGTDTSSGGGPPDTSGCGTICDGGSSESSTGSQAGPPVIVSVAWTNVPNCSVGVGSDVMFSIDVTDPDDAVATLTFSGMAIGCVGQFDGPMSTLLCPNAAPYGATIEVTDPDGNSDSIAFNFSPCEDGSAP